jgi:UDP-N-acetyl-D-glucosamine dehydrogenase
MDLLREKGAIVDYSDPHVPAFPKMRKYRFDLTSVDPTAAVVALYDCVIIATDHDAFDYAMLLNNAALIVDTRGRLSRKSANVFPA